VDVLEQGEASLVTRKKDWTLTGEAFERLLVSLDPNREVAGQTYESLRRKLIEFFEARGSRSPEDHTDETINRVARRIEEGEQVREPARYFYGVARLLWMETLRLRGKEPVALEEAPPAIASDQEEQTTLAQERERRLDCFEGCLRQLPPPNRLLIVEYYKEEKGLKIEQRRRQAQLLDMSLNALRLRACRIRAELEQCINSCLARSSKTRNQRTVTD
jgi:DNA-directed RNA polymerase specialized sigma24 family protein